MCVPDAGVCVVDVRVVTNRDGIHADGHRRYLPSDHLFGKNARDVEPGVYEDDGKVRVHVRRLVAATCTGAGCDT
jgi:hypothetical protein